MPNTLLYIPEMSSRRRPCLLVEGGGGQEVEDGVCQEEGAKSRVAILQGGVEGTGGLRYQVAPGGVSNGASLVAQHGTGKCHLPLKVGNTGTTHEGTITSSDLLVEANNLLLKL